MKKNRYSEKQIFGHVVSHPRTNQPNPSNWRYLQKTIRQILKDTHGKVVCGTCWREENGRYQFDLHHRHYDNWGQEKLEDVILLCNTCHEAITCRVRFEKYAHGWRDEDTMLCIQERPENLQIQHKETQEFVPLFTQTREQTTNRPKLVEKQPFVSAFTKTRERKL